MNTGYRWLVATAISVGCCGTAAAPPPAVVKGDPSKGEQVYARCMACHALSENRIGPRHCGLFGRHAGRLPGFNYSPAMRRSRIVWNEKALDRFLTDPQKVMPGTAMVFSGVPDPVERADLIAWLKIATASRANCPN